jgi:molybdenum cofactor biosynthesis enzyme MoaA
MSIEIGDKSLMMIFLLEECNFFCAHCGREDAPMDPGYKLSFEQLQSCLSDCRSLESTSWVHFSGGEPTLWTEGNRSLVDLLVEIGKAGYTPGFTTNGSYFLDYSKCHELFGKYFDNSNMPLRLYVSVDTFHGNFDAKAERAQSLDNVVRCKRGLSPEKWDLFNIAVLTTISKKRKSLLPDEMIKHYESLGVTFVFVPLYPIGKAKSFNHLCPDLNSDNPEDLGAYRRFHKKNKRKQRDKTKHQQRTDHIILIGDDYYFSDPWLKVAQLENLPDAIRHAYSIEAEA